MWAIVLWPRMTIDLFIYLIYKVRHIDCNMFWIIEVENVYMFTKKIVY